MINVTNFCSINAEIKSHGSSSQEMLNYHTTFAEVQRVKQTSKAKHDMMRLAEGGSIPEID